jgi:signal transduction histidine kinase
VLSIKVARFNSKEYAISILLALLAVALTAAVRAFLGGSAPLLLVTLAVTLAASYGGLGPGILTTLLSVACLKALFANSVIRVQPDEPTLVLLAALGFAISFIIEKFCRRNRAQLITQGLLEIANKTLAERSELLTQTNEELKRFVYALSHDLKTPLRSVSLFAEQLAEQIGDKFDKDAQTSLRFVRDGARQAQDMIGRLLDYALAANRDKAEIMTDLNAVLAGAQEDLRGRALDSNARVTNEQLPIVRADGDALRQLFLNLLANSIKYRGERSPEIHVSAGNTGQEWIISVRDNGIGIDPKYANKVFELFERLHSAAQYEGSGIGLAICRKIVQRHGGRIWVESELGHGCTFFFTLPVLKADRLPAALPVGPSPLELAAATAPV